MNTFKTDVNYDSTNWLHLTS